MAPRCAFGAPPPKKKLGRARKEGSVTLYTSMAPTGVGHFLKEFEKKYGI